MRNIFTLISLLFMTVFFVFCGGSKEVAKIPLDTVETETTDQMRSDVKSVAETETRKEAVEEKTPVVEELVFRDIYFAFDQHELSADAREIIAEHARKLKDNQQLNILIEGHCDERGTIEYNLALGERRAVTVKAYLINYGIHPERMYTISYGKERPLDLRQTEEAWTKNRRAVFKIVER